MGAFDYIKFNKKLPHDDANDLAYQTKDLDCCQLIYEVLEGGCLVRHSKDGPQPVDYTGPLEVRAYIDFLDARPKQPRNALTSYSLVKEGVVLSIIKDGWSPNTPIHPHYLEIGRTQWKEMTDGFSE